MSKHSLFIAHMEKGASSPAHANFHLKPGAMQIAVTEAGHADGEHGRTLSIEIPLDELLRCMKELSK